MHPVCTLSSVLDLDFVLFFLFFLLLLGTGTYVSPTESRGVVAMLVALIVVASVALVAPLPFELMLCVFFFEYACAIDVATLIRFVDAETIA